MVLRWSFLAMSAWITFIAPPCRSFLPGLGMTRQRISYLYEDLDDMRNMLESSWNVESMGQVPSTPESAAEEAASSIIEARNDGIGNICFVDLLLPQYDIQQGPNLYDEVEAVDFCRLLTDCLHTQSVIYVKDEKSLKEVSKVIDARERERRKKGEIEDLYEYTEMEVKIHEDGDIQQLVDKDDDLDLDVSDADATNSAVDIFNDFSDFASSEVDTFFSLEPSKTKGQTGGDLAQKQIASTWGGRSNDETKQEHKRTKIVKKLVRQKIDQSQGERAFQYRRYRLASLFGDHRISTGNDMSESVVQAVKEHGLPKAEEETMILLSANSDAEMLAIRALVAKYTATKKIVLVNCKLDPLPLELEHCHTVYHLTPLIATTTIDARNLFTKKREESKETTPIKIVSIRRYPGEWEVYVDADGNGFELAERASATKFTKKGPSLDWIAGAVKSFLT